MDKSPDRTATRPPRSRWRRGRPAGPVDGKAPPTDNILTLIHMMSNRTGRAFYGEIEARFGVSLAEWRVLLTLAQAPRMTANQITNRWAMEKMTVSRAIRRLEAKGHIRRMRNPRDRRSYFLTLTADGHRLFEKILPRANVRYHDIVSCLDRSELTALRDGLQKLIDRTRDLSI